MANTTPNLSLSLPGFGEFNNSWHTPMNANFTKIDTWAGEVNLELSNARFTKDTLAEFLAVGHNTDGTLVATQEIINARNSYLYGWDHATLEDDMLGNLSKARDTEVWKARGPSSSLQEALAYRDSFLPSKILDGAKDINGFPAWCGRTGAKVQVDGSVVPLILEINGKIGRVRTLKEVTISGGAGTYYVYADFQSDGVATYSGTSGSAGEDGPDGPLRIHRDIGKNYLLEDIVVGDVLRYLTTDLAGDYLINLVAPGGESDQLRTQSLFAKALASITYEIRDPLAVTLGFSATETPATGRIFIAEADFDGVAVTAVRARHFLDTFVSEWRAVNVSGGSPTFEESWYHNLGTDKLDVVVQASIANDGSQPVETLDTTRLNNTLAVSGAIGTLAVGIGTLATSATKGTLATLANTAPPDVHTHVVDGAPSASLSGAPSLTGSPSATLSGNVVPYSSVAVKYTRSRVWVKNVVSASFFRDYSGVDRATGYLRVIITKKG